MLGGLPTERLGYPLHCRLRYFDPERRRAGVPEDVAALVEKMTADDVTVTLVNINQVAERKVVVQGGAYAEHQLISASVDDREFPIDHSAFTVRLAPRSRQSPGNQDETLCQPADLRLSVGSWVDELP